jgi:hypothetical protein
MEESEISEERAIALLNASGTGVAGMQIYLIIVRIGKHPIVLE